MKALTILLPLLICCSAAAENDSSSAALRVAFWNVENYFDIYPDSTHLASNQRWTPRRFAQKRNNIYKTVAAMEFPAVVGLAEVENALVLRELTLGTPLRLMNYGFVHYESPDRRGIDNALLYRADRFTPFVQQALYVADTAEGFFTRDILFVGGVTCGGDTLLLLVNHFPSRLGGDIADRHRQTVAAKLRVIMDSLAAACPNAGIIVMGDFNAEPSDPVIRGITPEGAPYVNLMSGNVEAAFMVDNGPQSVSKQGVPRGWGSYKYHGYWSFIDQIIVSDNMVGKAASVNLTVDGCAAHVFNAPFLLCNDKGYMGKRPYRTWHGPSYQGGFSDHLPVYIDLKR
ncbi:MAG: endonuclease/exonuclease/phosphatase family protein [Bacteroidales bacterium]|nr:endonuclease/exonuclease/phosphatase family protein [Bacteroidales bacterium]